MPKTVCQSVAWFKRYKTLKSVTVGRSNLRKFSYSAKTRSAFGLARNKAAELILPASLYPQQWYVLKNRLKNIGKNIKNDYQNVYEKGGGYLSNIFQTLNARVTKLISG